MKWKMILGRPGAMISMAGLVERTLFLHSKRRFYTKCDDFYTNRMTISYRKMMTSCWEMLISYWEMLISYWEMWFPIEKCWFPIEKCWFPIEKCWFYNTKGRRPSSSLSYATKQEVSKTWWTLHWKRGTLHWKRGILHLKLWNCRGDGRLRTPLQGAILLNLCLKSWCFC